MPGSVEIKKVFLSSPRFAVVGASKDQTKYGTKVLRSFRYLATTILAHNFLSGFEVVSGTQ